jgi:hypothetical protein
VSSALEGADRQGYEHEQQPGEPGEGAERRGERVAVATVRARAASTTRVTGLTSANVSTTPGMSSTRTNAEEAKTSGKTQMKPRP